jgi:hypothetical protein
MVVGRNRIKHMTILYGDPIVCMYESLPCDDGIGLVCFLIACSWIGSSAGTVVTQEKAIVRESYHHR